MILLASKDKSDFWNSKCVGCRGVMDNQRWLTLTGKPETKFVFDSNEALDGQLIVPLDAAESHTLIRTQIGDTGIELSAGELPLRWLCDGFENSLLWICQIQPRHGTLRR